MFTVGQIVVVKSSGIRRKIEKVLSDDLFLTSSGDHMRTMKATNIATVEDYAKANEKRLAKLRKKFGKR